MALDLINKNINEYMKEEEEIYASRVKNNIDCFLTSDFMTYNPEEKSDDDIWYDAVCRSHVSYDGGLMAQMNSFCSVFTVDNIQDTEYNGKEFSFFNLIGRNRKFIWRLNLSDFAYSGCLDKNEPRQGFDLPYDESCARFVSTLDDEKVSLLNIQRMVGNEVLAGYWFPRITKFGKIRPCVRLYSLTEVADKDAAIIRKQILRAQAFALLLLAKHPGLCMVTRNWEKISPYYYTVANEVGASCEKQFRVKLAEIESKLNRLGLTYEFNI